jgi:hypothetical protein
LNKTWLCAVARGPPPPLHVETVVEDPTIDGRKRVCHSNLPARGLTKLQ